MEAFVHGQIHEFVPWYDTDGNVINASDGGMIFAEGKYHWYGQALQPLPYAPNGQGGQVTKKGVVMYSSEDLLNWQYEGVILAVSEDPESPLFAPMRFERPKIIYNDRTKQYVLWCHYVCCPGDHGSAPGTAEAGIAVSEQVNGPYHWLGTCRPGGDALVRDCTLYQTEDGTAYFLYDRDDMPNLGDRCLYAAELTADYLACTDRIFRIDAAQWREAPAIVFHDGKYHIITSGLTGWTPNQARGFRADCLTGPWQTVGDPCRRDPGGTTYNAQTTYAFPLQGEDKWIVMLERHNVSNFEQCSYIWLPAEFDADGNLYLEYRTQWKP